MKKQSITALKFLLAMTILTGIIYPFLMTGIAQLCYPSKANGSLMKKNGKIIGSKLIGQRFDSTIYFWSRPSATRYNPVPSGASNYGPASDTLKKIIAVRLESFAKMNSIADSLSIPKEMVFASASGLDPHISPGAALLQVKRISEARHFTPDQKKELVRRVNQLTEPPQFLFLGEERINVLSLNLELENIKDNLITKK